MRKIFLGLTAVAASTALVAGCGTSGSESATPSSASVSISQANGTIEYPVGDKRIVATGYSVDNVLALGVKPVAVVQLTQELPTPWQKQQLEGVPIIKATNPSKLPVEEIAKYNPDLFVGDHRLVQGENFTAVSGVTKVLGGVEEQGEAAGWDTQLPALGKILGKEKEAEKVIADDKAYVESVAKKYPGLKGKTAIVAQYIARSGNMNVIANPTDATNRLFSELGMTVPKAVQAEPRFTAAANRGMVSLELLPQIAANFMVMYPNGANADDLQKLTGYTALPQVQQNSTLVADINLLYSVYQPTSLSRKWFLEQADATLKTASEQQPVA